MVHRLRADEVDSLGESACTSTSGELTLEALLARKAAIGTEIAELNARLKPVAGRKRAKSVAGKGIKRRGMSGAVRKALSQRMKAYCAKKKAGKRARI